MEKFIKYLSLLYICLFFNSTFSTVSAQTNNQISHQLWFDFNPSYNLGRFDIYADLGARTIYPNEWHRFVIGPSVKYTIPKQLFKNFYHVNELHTGVRFFYTNNKNNDNILEIRLFQGYNLKIPRQRHDFQTYFRLEERFDINASNSENTFGLRFRISATYSYKFPLHKVKIEKGSYVKGNIELFFNLIGTEQFNDVIRFNAGYGKQINRLWRAEFLLGLFVARQTVDDKFQTNDMVYRLRTYYLIPHKKHKHNENDYN